MHWIAGDGHFVGAAGEAEKWRALVAKVSVDEKTGMCRVELVNFDAIASAKEAA